LPPVDADPIVLFQDQTAFLTWLSANGASCTGAWLQLAKKAPGAPTTVTYSEAVEAALIHGWIDGQKRSFDEVTFLQRFTPRSRRSIWSIINRGKAEALIAAGRMLPAGLAEVERAKADGRWANAYAGARTIEVPDDLRAALDANPSAAAFFAKLDGANRYAVLFRVHGAKPPATRARRIEQLVAVLGRGEKVHG